MNPSRTRTTVATTIIAGLATCGAPADDLTWTGAADGIDLFDEANWELDRAVPPAGTIDPNVAINHDVIVSTNPGTIGNSLAFNQFLTLGPAGSLTVRTGTLSVGNGGIVRDNASATDDHDNKTMTLIRKPFQPDPTVQASFLGEIDAVVQRDARLVLTSGLTPLFNSTIDLRFGQLELANETVQATIAEHLSKLTVWGLPAVIGANPAVYEPGDTLQILSDGAAGSIIRGDIIPGDTDLDRDIDNTDLQTMMANFTGPTNIRDKTWMDGDFDNQGDVDGTDLQIAIANFTGPIKPVASPASAPVPEPASLTLITLGGLLVCRRRG